MKSYRFLGCPALSFALTVMAGCNMVLPGGGETQYSAQVTNSMPAANNQAAETAAKKQNAALDYAVSRKNMERIYQNLAARMTLKQQLALSSEQTAWLNMRDLDCIQSMNENRCKFIMTQTRTAVLENSLRAFERTGSTPSRTLMVAAGSSGQPVRRVGVASAYIVKATPAVAAANSAGVSAPVSPSATAPVPNAVSRSVTLNVAATAMPWLWNSEGINSPYAFGYPDGTPPAAVKLDQLGARPGGHIMIKYITGKITLGPGTPATDALGYTKLDGLNDAGPAGKYPSAYIPMGTASLGALVGVFTKTDGSIVGSPFAVGDGLATVAVPTGANRLQLGINDDIYGAEDPGSGNAGAFSVQVSAD